MDFICGKCRSRVNHGIMNRSFDNPKKCISCREIFCINCISSDEELKNGICSLCGGELKVHRGY